MSNKRLDFYQSKNCFQRFKIDKKYFCHRWAHFCLGTICIILFLFIILFVLQDNILLESTTLPVQPSGTIYPAPAKFNYERNPCYAQLQCMDDKNNRNCKCFFTCANMNAEDLKDKIMEVMPEAECTSVMLWINKVKFPNQQLKSDWFTSSLPLSELTIDDCLYNSVIGSPFNTNTFVSLDKLILIKTNLQLLNREMFVGLQKLTYLSIQQQNREYLKFEKNILADLKSLAVIQIHYAISTEADLINLTGTSLLPSIREIDFRFNKLSSIPAHAFQTPWLLRLHLTSNNLKSIHVDAFDELKHILHVRLDGNKLEELPEQLFDGAACLEMYIRGNNLRCDCKLAWLKNMLVLDWNNTVCSSGVNISEYDFSCEASTTTEIQSETSTSSLSSTGTWDISSTKNMDEGSSNSSSTDVPSNNTKVTSTSTVSASIIPSSIFTTAKTSTTKSEDNYIDLVKLTCRDARVHGDDYVIERMQVVESTVRNKSATILVKESEDHSINVIINGITKDHYFIWMNSDDPDECGCFTNFPNLLILKHFTPDNNFIFCLISKDEVTVSPLDCTSFKTSPKEEDQIWLSQVYKWPLIAGAISVLILSIMLTAVIVFYYVRRNPKVLRGNKRVVIVKNSSADVLVMPKKPSKTYSEHSESTLRVGTQPTGNVDVHPNKKDTVYLSPISQRYAKVRPRPPLLRSWSELSDRTTVASYVAALEPKDSWTKCSRKKFSSVDECCEEPPPLPPPRNRNSYVEYISELVRENLS